MRRHLLFLSIVVGLMASLPAFAQQITGRVTDQQGLVVPTAKITVHNQATGVDTPSETTSAGVYTVPYLKPGVYTVKAEAKGFQGEQKTDVPLEQNQVSTVNFTLKVGQVTDTVTVKADKVMLDFQSVTTGDSLSANQLYSLPSTQFNSFYSATLFAGYRNATLPSASNSSLSNHVETSTLINNNGVDIQIDGMPATQALVAAAAYTPPTNMLQEMKVSTTPFDASMGFKTGGQVSMTLKSGSNALHGQVNYDGQRGWLNANTWKNNNLGKARASSKQDAYGFELDGPVVIPHLYDGRNKTFFMLGYSGQNNPSQGTLTSSVGDRTWWTPTCTNATDPNCYFDFSGLKTSATDPATGKTAQLATPIYNPYSGQWVKESSGTYLKRSQFPNNHIPYGLVACGQNYLSGVCDPAAQANYKLASNLLGLFPKANAVPGSGSLWQNNYVLTTPNTNIQRNTAAKIDHNFSDNTRAFLSYGYWDQFGTASSNWGRSNPADFAGAHYNNSSVNQLMSLSVVHVINPNLVAEFKGNVGVRRDTDTTGPGQGFDPTSLGFGSSLVNLDRNLLSRFPKISIGGLTQLGAQTGLLRVANIMNMAPSVTWVKGAHSLRAGAEFRYNQQATRFSGGVGLQLGVGTGWTSNPDSVDVQNTYCNGKACSYPTGNGVASLLLGTWDNSNNAVSTFIKDLHSRHYMAYWVQDDWKVTPKLTLNLGLRWDIPFIDSERFNRMNYGFDFSTPNTVVNSQMAALKQTMPNNTQIVGGLGYAGVNGNPTRPFARVDLHAINPRLGASYAINDKTVLHLGVATTSADDVIYTTAGSQNWGFTANTGYTGSIDNGITPLQNLANPISALTAAPGASLGLNAGLGNSISFANPNGHLPRPYLQLTLGIQRQLSSVDSLEIDYQGSRMYNAATNVDINHISAAYQAMCDAARGGNVHLCDDNNQKIANPFKGVAAFYGTNYYTDTTINKSVLTKPFPQFGSITENYYANMGRNSYNSLQVIEKHRMGHGLTIVGTYTYSKTLNWGNYADFTNNIIAKSIDGTDIPHRVTVNASYQIPVGKGRTLFGGSSRVVDGIVGGWNVAATFVRQSGVPWDPNSSSQKYYYVGNAKVSRYETSSTDYTKFNIPAGSFRGVAPCVGYYDATKAGSPLTMRTYSQAYGCSAINFVEVPSYGVNPSIEYSGIRLGSANSFDASLSKSFTVTEKVRLAVRMDAFNVMNHPTWTQSYSTGSNANFGTIIRGSSGVDQSNLPRVLQLGARINW